MSNWLNAGPTLTHYLTSVGVCVCELAASSQHADCAVPLSHTLAQLSLCGLCVDRSTLRAAAQHQLSIDQTSWHSASQRRHREIQLSDILLINKSELISSNCAQLCISFTIGVINYGLY